MQIKNSYFDAMDRYCFLIVKTCAKIEKIDNIYSNMYTYINIFYIHLIRFEMY